LTAQAPAGEASTLLDPDGAATRNASAAITALRAIRARMATRLTVSVAAVFAVVDSRFLKEMSGLAGQEA